MPNRLMFSALQVFADSILAYIKKDEREGEIRYYPAVVLTFWSGFECFVRHSSEKLLQTVPNVPTAVANFLRETESIVEADGTIRTRARYQSVLDRYSAFIFYAYGHKIDRGNAFWQELKKAPTRRGAKTQSEIEGALRSSQMYLAEARFGLNVGNRRVARKGRLGKTRRRDAGRERAEPFDLGPNLPCGVPRDKIAKEALLSACDAKTDDNRQTLLELARTWTQAALVERQSINYDGLAALIGPARHAR